MKVVDKSAQHNHKTFSEIKIGETFYVTSPDTIYMKTQNFYSEYDDGYYFDCWVLANAFCLNDGKKAKFAPNDKINLVRCECVIINK